MSLNFLTAISPAHDRQAAHLSRVVQNQRYPYHTVEKHEAARVDPEPIKDDPKQDRQDKAAKRADKPDNAGNNTHVLRKVVADIFECGGHAAGECNAQCKQQQRERQRRQSDVELSGTADRMHDEVSLRIRQEEEADPSGPQDPPSHVMRAVVIRQPAADCPQHAASSEASAMLSSYFFTKYCGIQTDRAVKPPKTIE